MSGFIEKVAGDLADKRRWREHRARVKTLPTAYRRAVEALERYLIYRVINGEAITGAVTKGDVLVDLYQELAEVFERAAADGTPIREVVGADPLRFADMLLSKYAAAGWSDKEWIDKEQHKEQQRLVGTIAQAEAEDGSTPS
ncbi:MAG: DUF1048 domain-containing protein [Streptosporangiales bacterium]|nr:DUF1048 domain-containing protein [Streptosporangiales bacterium]